MDGVLDVFSNEMNQIAMSLLLLIGIMVGFAIIAYVLTIKIRFLDSVRGNIAALASVGGFFVWMNNF